MKKNLKVAPILHLAHGAHVAYLTCDGKNLAHVKYGICGKCALVKIRCFRNPNLTKVSF